MKFFRNLIALLFVAVLSPSADAWYKGSNPFPSNSGGMLLGLGPTSYFSNGPQFLNWAQSTGASGLFVDLVAGGTQSIATTFANGQMDTTNGELVPGAGLSTLLDIKKLIFTPTPFAPVIPPLNGASPWWNGLAMTVTWTGTSTVTQQGTLGTGSTALSCGANSCTFTFGSNPVNVALSFAITNVNDPPKNIFVYETKFASNVAALAACITAQGSSSTNCNHFSPDWINLVKGFGRLRPMDIMNVNASGPSEISQLADFNYQPCVGCAFNGIGVGVATIDNGSGSAGNTLTVTNNLAQSGWAVGQTVAGPGVTGSPVITALGTGTGGNGTYTVNGSAQLVASNTLSGTQIPGTFFGGSGAKGGIHPSWAVELSKVTGSDIHYNLPVNISNAGMTAVATYFCTNMPAGHKVFYELGNENWNSNLGITYRWLGVAGNALFGGVLNGVEYGGYRMGQLMTLVQSACGGKSYDKIRNPTGTWAGVIGGQMVSNASVPISFVNGFNTWQAGCSCSTVITDLFDEVVVAPYFADFPSTTSVPTNLQSMITASAACFASAGGSITGSISAGVLTVSAGSVTLGQGLTGAGLPANLYINSGSGPYNLNQSVTVGSESMTTVPCSTTYQFFSQQYAKLLTTGSNDFGYTGTSLIPITGFQNILNVNALYANSLGLQLSEYEGGNSVEGIGAVNTANGYITNWQWDAAGNDPLYTPALVYQSVFQMLRNVHSAYSGKYVEQTEADFFSGVRYLGDSNPSWSAIVAENALGPYVDPTPAATWSANYNSATDNNFGSGSATTLTCAYTAPSNGLAVILTSQKSTTHPTQVQIDSNTPITIADASDTTNAWNPDIWSQTVTAGAHTITVTWPSGQTLRNCAALTLTNLASNIVQSVSTQGQHNQTIAETTGSFIISVAAPPLGFAPTWQASSTPSGTISGCPSACSNVNTFQISTSNAFAFAYWSPGPPFNSAIFGINNTNANGMISAAYK